MYILKEKTYEKEYNLDILKKINMIFETKVILDLELISIRSLLQ